MAFALDRKQTVAKNLEAAVAYIADLEGKASVAAQELADARASVASITAERDALTGKANELTAQLAEANKSLAEAKAAVIDFDAKVAAKVLDEVAKQGVPPVAKTDKDESKPTVAQLWEQYHSIEDPAKRAIFYREHKELHPSR